MKKPQLQSGMDDRFKAALHEIAARADAAEKDPRGLAPEVAMLAKAGILTACLPVHDGGQGLATSPEASSTLFDVLRRIGRANLSLGRLFEGHVNAVKLVSLYGGAMAVAEMARNVSEGGFLASGARMVENLSAMWRRVGRTIFPVKKSLLPAWAWCDWRLSRCTLLKRPIRHLSSL
ncbi:hypothetical protein CGLAMM_10945 [Acetobacteraceae bacterium EV16G]|uniref:hypothetical protein n=1 Tax=Sorlinia euscelidii TaxID=3081148 RepID=UPI002F3B7ECC